MEERDHTKIKFGAHEFEASGSPESVREKFQAFMEMIKTLGIAPQQVLPAPKPQEEPYDPNKIWDLAEKSPLAVDNGLPQIMRVDGRTISLTARPTDISNAIIAILYGQKILRQNDGVTGAEVVQGLRATGGYTFDRVDRVLEGIARGGDIVAFGEHRGKRYRLTNVGLSKARALAADMILNVGGTL
jgi:hypothetical protein